MVDAISSALSSSISGLKAQEKKLANIADNIANASTANYVPKDTVMISDEAQLLATTIQQSSGGVNLDEQMIGSLEAEHAFKASIETLKTASDMYKTLLDVLARKQ